MTLRVSGKNIDIGEALRSRIETRISEIVGKYFEGGYNGHATVEPEGSAFRTDCSIHLDTGIVLKSSAVAHDAYQSFDATADRIEKRLRRYKSRLRGRHGHHDQASGALEAAAYVLASTETEEELPADHSPLVIAETSTRIKTMTVGMAVMELDLTEAPVVVFRNAAHGGVNVVFRRADGNVSWIDPALIATPNGA
ncbi:ribosome hibernation-promoting factor, HPF/YfiA family [Segnochrobactrum spirostomi]|uniref:Ribosome hibernation promoting factor n=1 Tax=Segnochrobactrum spirostomi TaxID=2608987 RepID=A0A6A7Y4M8_9HYPH|nr:ribosome-associated translation inhibitor RaiA [Segnochrobactrum spirostomi]MQT13327.1 ribosome-associated translation inhibitor RaiA [Segnochrobactrum spirostomi]